MRLTEPALYLACGLSLATMALALPQGQTKLSAGSKARSPRSARSSSPQVAELASFRTWKKANERPLRLPAPLDYLCRPATIKDSIQTSANPHRKKWFTVFMNPAAQKPLLDARAPRFPAGSVVVKEKVTDKEGKHPELLTAMVKRQKGFNPKSGDWEYVVAGADGRVIQQGRLDNCASCHAQAKSTDYVFRTYLQKPPKVEARASGLLR
jgi:hypothetical protein